MVQVFRKDARFSHGGHKIRIAVPARNNMDMEMIIDPGAGDLSQIHAEIEASGLQGFF